MKKKMGGFKLGFDNPRLRRYGPYILAGLVTLLIISLYLDNHRLLATWELGIQDTMVSLGQKSSPPQDVVIVTIDDVAVEQLGQWPWDAERVGYVVGMLAEYDPKAIGLDFEITADALDDPVGTQFLADMIAKAGNVVLPLRFTLGDGPLPAAPAEDYLIESSVVTFDQAIALMDYPYPQAHRIYHPYATACRAAWGLGQINTWQDVDGKVRREPLVVKYQGEFYPSMAFQLARCAQGIPRAQVHMEPGEGLITGSTVVPTDNAGMMRIDYRGPAGTIPSLSAARVLDGDDLHAQIAGKVVVVGVTAEGYGTALNTPASSEMPRTEKIATVAANILGGRYITSVQLSTLIDLLILTAIGVFCAFVLPRVILVYRVAILLVMAFLFIDLNFVLYNSFQLVTKTLYPSLQILLFLVLSPVMKQWSPDAEDVETKDKRADVPARPQSVKAERSDRPEDSPGTDSEQIPVRVVHEGGPAGAIGGLERTTGISAQAVTEETSTPEPIATGTVSDLMDATPQPLGAESGNDVPTPASNDGIDPQEVEGKTLGRYELLGIVGQGAMGTVYKGKDPAIDRMVALKTIRAGIGADPAQAEELRERLVREAKAAGKLSHPNIVTVYDVGAEGDLRYIAMEYLEGYTLEQMIKKNVQLNYNIAAKMIMQVCAALEYAHNAGIVHRDIKPANIMVLDNFKIKVTDFGIARFDSPQMSMTQTGIAMGTPHYISPEQLRGEPVDRRCDIFSLGVVAYELLTRRRPFAGENISSLIYSITQTTPEPPSSIDENIPGLFDMVIGRALKKDPLERYQSADQMAQDLRAFVQDSATPAFRV
jgi:serine/threonine-protein kinase